MRLDRALHGCEITETEHDPKQQELARILQQELKDGSHDYMFDPDETRAWVAQLREQYDKLGT